MLDKRNNIKHRRTPDINPDIIYYDLYEVKEINESPGVFYFLIDQSASMKGNSITIGKESLKLFIKSLPVNSYFDIIG